VGRRSCYRLFESFNQASEHGTGIELEETANLAGYEVEVSLSVRSLSAGAGVRRECRRSAHHGAEEFAPPGLHGWVLFGELREIIDEEDAVCILEGRGSRGRRFRFDLGSFASCAPAGRGWGFGTGGVFFV